MASGQVIEKLAKKENKALRIAFATAAGAGIAALAATAQSLTAGAFNGAAVANASIFAGLASLVAGGIYENHIMPRVARNMYKQPDSEGPGW